MTQLQERIKGKIERFGGAAAWAQLGDLVLKMNDHQLREWLHVLAAAEEEGRRDGERGIR